MKRRANNGHRLGTIATLCVAALVGTACPLQAGEQAAPAGQSQPLDQLTSAGKDASLTVLPVNLGGNPSPQVGEVLGMLLERAGMKNLEVGVTEFRPPEKADLAQTGASLGEFVRANPPATDYALFADFLGSPGKGVAEVRGVIVNKQGEVVWQDRQTATDADFTRLKAGEPMTCCLLLVERLREPLNRALQDRRTFYEVRVESVGRVGEVLVTITGLKGHLPLFFGVEELEPGFVSRVVRDTVSRFGL